MYIYRQTEQNRFLFFYFLLNTGLHKISNKNMINLLLIRYFEDFSPSNIIDKSVKQLVKELSYRKYVHRIEWTSSYISHVTFFV